ncbi:LOW QUALITY PROTEIN: uncharacterized protein ACR2FA_010520 [Aphomia sociella]
MRKYTQKTIANRRDKHVSFYSISAYFSRKICFNCGVPGLGTSMHLDHANMAGSMHPATKPPEFLLTRLIIIDVSHMSQLNPNLVLTLDVALQIPLKHDPHEPTLLFFGWKYTPKSIKSCTCNIPGLSYELAEWIATNLTHVVGVATNTPTLESQQTQELNNRTIAYILGKRGVYMIENVMKSKIDRGCMSIAMPLKMHIHYVPTRLTAFCPSKTDQVMMALRKIGDLKKTPSTVYDVNLDEILN